MPDVESSAIHVVTIASSDAPFAATLRALRVSQ
jgi:hypothetical protein